MIAQSAGLRQLAITFQPASRKASAESRPMPLEHPVIKIDFMMMAFLIGFRFCAVSLGV
jgi:hypothetical protein